MYLLLIIHSTVFASMSVNMKGPVMSLSKGSTKTSLFSLLPAFDDILPSLLYRIPTETCEYFDLGVQDDAHFPLLHFVMDDLPTRTRPPVLGDSNTTGLLKRDHGPITSFAVGNNCCASPTTPCHGNRPGFLI